MFILTTISDLVQISPEDLEKPSAEAIEDNLNTKYSNKVIQKIGLCICVYDILSASDGLIGHGTGVINVNVEFRLIVFRPFKGEIITGRIAGATEAGIRVSLDFFEDIWVPSHLLFSDSSFNAAEQTWVWHSESGDFYFDRNEWVRVRVETEQWHDLSPVAPAEREAVNSMERKSPYSITSIDGTGLSVRVGFNNHTGTRLGRMVVMALVISGEDCASDEFNVGECY